MTRLAPSLPGLLALALLVPALARADEPPAPPRPAALDELEALRATAFHPARLRARREALLAALPPGAVVVLQAAPEGEDVFPYRQAPDFLYLSGVSSPGYSLLLAEGLDVLFAPPDSREYALWNGERLTPGSPLAAASGFAEVVERGERSARVSAALGDAGRLYLLGLELGDLELVGHERPPRVSSPADALAALRQVKDPGEQALLQRAIDITCAGLTEAIRSIRPGRYEFEAQADLEYLFLRHGAQRPGFTSIIGSGPNSCVLHYGANRRRIGEGELVVMDVGAELFGYTADVTRTVPASGKFSPRQREIYQLVLKAQDAGIAAVRSGSTLRAVHDAARQVIAEAGYGAAFPHGTSHWLGLDVHDVGNYNRPLSPGMVLTVEPGIYLRDEALGVRIEDDVLVTEDGCRLLSSGVPRDPDALEALLAQRGIGDQEVAPVPARPGPQERRLFQRGSR